MLHFSPLSLMKCIKQLYPNFTSGEINTLKYWKIYSTSQKNKLQTEEFMSVLKILYNLIGKYKGTKQSACGQLHER